VKMQDLLKKLQSLGLPIKKASGLEKRETKVQGLDQVFDGKWVKANDRKVFLIEKCIPFGKIFGSKNVSKEKISDHLHRLFRLEGNPWKSYKEFVFLDTETSSLSLGAGSFIFMIGICFFTQNGLQIEQLIMPDVIHEVLLLNYLDKKLEKFSTVVTYNGKSFDAPIIKSRSIINGVSSSIDKLVHIDLLHTSRKIWKLRLESRKLSDIENHILGIKRSEDEIPGWLVPQMYFDFLESGDAELLRGVVYHNEMDVISLSVLFNLFNLMAAHDFAQMKKENSLDALAVGDILRKGKQFELAGKVFEMGLSDSDISLIPKELLRKYAIMLKRDRKWQRAIHLWQIAADKGDFLSCIEIAKYYEHRDRNYEEALKWSQAALKLLISDGSQENKIGLINHRIHRLEKKVKMEKENGE